MWIKTLREKIEARTARVSVIGLGYVGLSLAVELAKAGIVVRGIDLDLERVSLLNRGESYLVDVAGGRAGAPGRERAADRDRPPSSRRAIPTRSSSACRRPLRKSKEPDISFILSAVESLLPHLRPGQLMVLESTTYPGHHRGGGPAAAGGRRARDRQRLLPGLLAGTGGPGQQALHHREHPEGGRRRDAGVHGAGGGAVPAGDPSVFEASSPRVAETAKLLENTFRSVNIALANELAFACRKIGVDPWEVIEAAATKPFGFMPFYPGPGHRRALHSGGPAVPLLEGAAHRVRGPVHRARRSDQPGDAGARRQPRRGGSERSRAGGPRIVGAGDGRHVQGRTSTTSGSRPRSRSSRCWSGRVRVVSYADPFAPQLVDRRISS